MPALTQDVIIIGAGAAGLMTALEAGRRKRKTLVLEHNVKAGAKILISGGGRCNFTNLKVTPHNFVSGQSSFCAGILSRFSPDDFLKLVKKHQVPFYEKKLGQLFCKTSAKEIVKMLLTECESQDVQFKYGVKIESCRFRTDLNCFELLTNQGELFALSLVICTGGLSFPQIGASDFGYKFAQQFKMRVTSKYPALDGFVWNDEDQKRFGALSGISLDVRTTCGELSFEESLLFTHKGLSGPAALQASLYWLPNKVVNVNFIPRVNLKALLEEQVKMKSRTLVKNVLAKHLPLRFSEVFCQEEDLAEIPVMEISREKVERLTNRLQSFSFVPKCTVGYNKAEVTKGGVDTRDLNPETLESLTQKGLFFAGEVIDVTGWLGGYNFHWAWASGFVVGQNV